MTLQIITPESVSEHTVEAVFLPGAAGAFEVLKGHAPIISALSAGEVRWRDASGEHAQPLQGGMVMVENDIIKVCAE